MTYKTLAISGAMLALALGSISIASAQSDNSGGFRRFLPAFLGGKSENRPATTTRPSMASSTRPMQAKPAGKDERRASSTAPVAVNAECAKAAVTARQAALSTALTSFAGKAQSLLEARETLIKGSFDKGTQAEAMATRKAAREAYKKSMREAAGPKGTFKTSEKAAYDAYNTAIKACGGTVESASSASEGGLLTI